MAEPVVPPERVIAEMVRYLIAQSQLGEPAPWYHRGTTYADLMRMGDTGEMVVPGDPGVSILQDDGGMLTTRNKVDWRGDREESLANAIAARNAREFSQGQRGWQPGAERTTIDWRTGRPEVPDLYLGRRMRSGQLAEFFVPWAERNRENMRTVEVTYTPPGQPKGPPAPGRTAPGPFPEPRASGQGGYEEKEKPRRRRSSGAGGGRYGHR